MCEREANDFPSFAPERAARHGPERDRHVEGEAAPANPVPTVYAIRT
jgi:hypothetical protein